MKSLLFSLFISIFLLRVFGQATTEVSPDSLAKHVYFLASDELQGRNTGSPGLQLAGQYIAGYFSDFGLIPAGNSDENPYFQEFALYSHVVYLRFPAFKHQIDHQYGNSSKNFMYFGTKTGTGSWHEETIRTIPGQSCGDTIVYRFFSAGDIGTMADSVRFLYENCSNRRFITLLPDEAFGHVSLGQPNWNSLLYKQNNQFQFVQPLNKADGNSFAAFEFVNSFVRNMGNIELILINQSFLLDRGYLPNVTALLDSVQFKIYKSQVHDTVFTENVAGYIESNRKTSRSIVIGAHHDHIGYSNKGIYNGADDNASGTAALIELARLFSQPEVQRALNANILFIAFSAEEKGLLGSEIYTEFPFFPLDSTIVMLNMDMIGRLEILQNRKGQVLFQAYGNQSRQIRKTVRQLARKGKFIKVYVHTGLVNRIGYKRGSDHYPFVKKGVPSGVFFTGLHSDYHKTTDTPEKVNYRNMSQIVKLVYLTALSF